MAPLTSYTRKLELAQGLALERYLRAHGYAFASVPHARFAARQAKVNVVFYESGQLVVQGKGTQDFVEFVLEPEILGKAELGYEAVLHPERFEPHLGVDESGKGDFFGPLCVAGVYVNATIVEAWAGLGIRDSKKIGSDRRIAELARAIRTTPGCLATVVPIGNEAYNQLHAKLRTVNAVLAWAHARVIENLLEREREMHPPPRRAVSDQFAASKATVERALMRRGRQLELVQRHRAEDDPAVAAASILARDEFTTRLAALSREYGLGLPKGGGGAVDEAAREFVTRYGRDGLARIAKLHFRNALRVADTVRSDGGTGPDGGSAGKLGERGSRGASSGGKNGAEND